MIIKRKLFTKYDDTDNLKRMKDSDILAEKPKQAPGYGSVAGAALGGAALGFLSHLGIGRLLGHSG